MNVLLVPPNRFVLVKGLVLSHEIGWEETSTKWPILCRVGRETLTRSILDKGQSNGFQRQHNNVLSAVFVDCRKYFKCICLCNNIMSINPVLLMHWRRWYCVVDVDQAVSMFGQLQQVDPYRLDNMDTYSNLLYVKVCYLHYYFLLFLLDCITTIARRGLLWMTE